jgi:hypothetical protein
VAGHEIGVEVGLKDVFDFRAAASCAVEVGLYFAEGVDDGGLAVAFDVVSALRQATRINLLNDMHAAEIESVVMLLLIDAAKLPLSG